MAPTTLFDLTPTQLYIWHGMQQHPDAPIYNMVATFRMPTTLDPDIFSGAFEHVVAGSDILRSTFAEWNGLPQRRVEPDPPGGVDRVELGSGRDFDHWMKKRAKRGLNLAQACYDCALVTAADGTVIWYLNQHHLISDAWSTQLIYELAATRYRQLTQGEPDPGVVQPAYYEYARGLANLPLSSTRQAAIEYWNSRASDASEVPAPAFYGRTPVVSSSASERVTLRLDQEQSSALEQLIASKNLRSLSRNITVFQIFLTVLFAFLYRSSGQSRAVVGTPLMNRSNAALRKTIGPLMEVYSLQVDMASDDSFSSLYSKVRTRTLELFRHGLPGTGSAALVRGFNVLLNFVNASFGDFDGVPVEARFEHAGASEPRHLLRVQIRDLGQCGSFSIDLDFNCHTFPPVWREHATRQFLELLNAFLVDRETPIAKINLLAPEERRKLRSLRSASISPHPGGLPLHKRFDQAARHSPSLAAIVDETGSITFGELERKANQLANLLIARGVQRGEPVALLLERGVSLIVGILATLKAGAMYLPVDIDLPRGRQDLLLDSPSLRMAVCTSNTLAAVSDGRAMEFIRIDGDAEVIERTSSLTPEIEVDLDDSAYVLFTSGSTGFPKGVECTHRGVVNLLEDFELRKPVQREESCSLWTSPGFDVSVYEIFSSLLFGGTLHVVPAHVRADAKAYFSWLSERDIVNAYVPPFMLSSFVAACEQGEARLALERLLVGVEPIPGATLSALARLHPKLHIINGYGPTEATICATLYSVTAKLNGSLPTPIGKPVRNCFVSVLDPFGHPVPAGAPGELFIGGVGVARGYLGQPELTRERFVRDPLDPAGTHRLYRTGDRVRYLADGNLEFLGRNDDQLKVRGQRVEPGEIERALEAHSSVHGARVVAFDTDDRGKLLVGYLVTDGSDENDVARWFARLRDRLPEYMIPTHYVTLPAFPLTSSGKVDRAALPRPNLTTRGVKPTHVAPRNPTEATLAEIWGRILGIEAVGVDDHFIDHGGDSISATRVATAAREADIEISPRQVFEYPTVAELARFVTANSPAPGTRHLASSGGVGTGLDAMASAAGISNDELNQIIAEYGQGDT